MSQKCLVCDSTSFTLEDGISTCAECGSHQLNFVELIDEEEAWEPNRTKFFIDPTTKQNKGRRKGRVEDTLDWSYIEAYNIILKRWTDVLVDLGASANLRNAVFKLWVCYLQKRGIAFCGNERCDSSLNEKIGVLETRDMVVLKKVKIEQKESAKEEKAKPGSLEYVKEKVRRKQWRSRDVGKSTQTTMQRYISSQMSETLNVFHEEMEDGNTDDEEGREDKEEKIDASLFCNTVLEDIEDQNNEEESPAATPPPPPDEEEVKIEKKHKKYVLNNERGISEHFLLLSPIYMCLEKLLSFVYLAVLMTDENILLLDLLRWCREDFIPYHSAVYLLDRNKLIKSGELRVFNRKLPAAPEARFHAGQLAYYLSLQSLPLHSLENVINELIDALQLPDDLRSTSLHTLKCFFFRGFTQYSVPPVETTAAAAILLTFKVTFGLDDVHEEILSDCADTLNKILKAEKKEFRLFSWRKWHKHMNKLMWWADRMMVSNWSHDRRPRVKPPVDSKRFNQYFWTKGVWKAPIEPRSEKIENNSTWDSCLLTLSLGLNLKGLDQVVKAEQLFKPYKTPLIGLVKQYIYGAQIRDVVNDHEEQHKIAKTLSSISFSNHRFNWLLHNYEITAEFNDFGREINIVKIPIGNREQCRSKITKLQRDIHSTIMYIPDPLKSYRPYNSSTLDDGLQGGNGGNFMWLVRLLSRICETNSDDILKQFIRIEGKFLSANNFDLKERKISLAEGEILRHKI